MHRTSSVLKALLAFAVLAVFFAPPLPAPVTFGREKLKSGKAEHDVTKKDQKKGEAKQNANRTTGGDKVTGTSKTQGDFNLSSKGQDQQGGKVTGTSKTQGDFNLSSKGQGKQGDTKKGATPAKKGDGKKETKQ